MFLSVKLKKNTEENIYDSKAEKKSFKDKKEHRTHTLTHTH